MKKIFIVLFFFVSFSSQLVMAHELKWDDLMLAAVKLNPHFDYDSNIDSYMQIYRPDVWDRVKNDEFELQDKRIETLNIMKERVSSFSVDEDFFVNTAIQFQDYDFEKGAFPVVKMSPNSYFSDAKYVWNKSFPHEYKVFFKNPDFFQDVAMSKDEAKSFIQSRKDRMGNVNRALSTQLRFRVIKLKNTRDELEAEIVGVTTYRDDKQASILQQY